MPPEIQRLTPQESESIEQVERMHGLNLESQRLQRNLGAPLDLPRELTEPELQNFHADFLARRTGRLLTSGNEVFFRDALLMRGTAMRTLARLNTPPPPANRQVLEAEHIVSNQEANMNFYLPALLQHTTAFSNATAIRVRELLQSAQPGNQPGQRAWLIEQLRRSTIHTTDLADRTGELRHIANIEMLKSRIARTSAAIEGMSKLRTEAEWNTMWRGTGNADNSVLRLELDKTIALATRKERATQGITSTQQTAANNRQRIERLLELWRTGAANAPQAFEAFLSEVPSLDLFRGQDKTPMERLQDLLRFATNDQGLQELRTQISAINNDDQWDVFMRVHAGLYTETDRHLGATVAERVRWAQGILQPKVAENGEYRTLLRQEISMVPWGSVDATTTRGHIASVTESRDAQALQNLVSTTPFLQILLNRLEAGATLSFEKRKQGLQHLLEEHLMRMLALQGTTPEQQREYFAISRSVLTRRRDHAKNLQQAPGIDPLDLETLEQQEKTLNERIAALEADAKNPSGTKMTNHYRLYVRSRIVDRLAGFAEPPDGTARSGPHLLYSKLLTQRYNQLHALGVSIARNEHIRAENKPRMQEQLNQQRRGIMEEMIMTSGMLGQFQVAMAELRGHQEQWGQHFDMTNGRPVNIDQPAAANIVRQNAEAAEQNRQQHADALLGHVKTIEAGFSPNAIAALNDLAEMDITKALERVSQQLSNGLKGVLVGWVPGVGDQLRNGLDTMLPLSLSEALGQVISRDLENLKRGQQVDNLTLASVDKALAERFGAAWNAMSDEKKDEKRKIFLLDYRLDTVRTALQAFQKTQVSSRLRESVIAFKALPPAQEFSGGQPGDEAAAKFMRENNLLDNNGRVTKAQVAAFTQLRRAGALRNNDALYKNVGVALYQQTNRQMQDDWGNAGRRNGEGRSGYMGELRRMVDSIENTIDRRLELIASCFEVASSWRNVGWGAVGLAAGVLAAPVVVSGYMAYNTVRSVWGFFRGAPAAGGAAPGAAPAAGGAAPGAAPAAGGAARAGAGRLGRAGSNVMAAYFTYRAGMDAWRANVEIPREVRNERTRMMDQLYASGFRGWDGTRWVNPADAQQKYTATEFHFRPDGEAPDRAPNDEDRRKTMVVRLNTIDEAGSNMSAFYNWRAGLGGAQAALALGMRRGGWAAVGCAVFIAAIEVGNAIHEEIRVANSVSRFPPWLLANMQTRGIFNLSHYEMLEYLSRGPGQAVGMNETNNRTARMKLFFALFHRELSEFPELARDFYDEGGHIGELERFFESAPNTPGEFQTVFLPLLYLCLHRRYGESRMGWSVIKEGRINRFHLIQLIQTPIGMVEMKAGLREAAILYMQHKSEHRYQDARQLLARYRAQPHRDPRIENMLQVQVEQLGNQKAFGTRLSDTQNLPMGQTRAQRMMTLLQQRLDSNPRSNQTIAATDNIPGLPQGFDLNDATNIYRLVEDPVLREALQIASRFHSEFNIAFTLNKRTTFEEGGGTTNNPGAGIVPPAFEQAQNTYMLPAHLREGADEAYRKRLVEKVNAIGDLLRGRVREFDNTDPDTIPRAPANLHQGAGQRALTEGIMRLFGTYRTERNRRAPNTVEPHMRAFGSRLPAQERAMNGPPPFFFTHTIENRPQRKIILPNFEQLTQAYPEFTPARLQGVFVEEQRIPGDKVVFGTTLFFGDNPNDDNMTVVQFGDIVPAADFDRDNAAIRADGVMCMSRLPQFLANQAQAPQMLQRLRTARPLGQHNNDPQADVEAARKQGEHVVQPRVGVMNLPAAVGLDLRPQPPVQQNVAAPELAAPQQVPAGQWQERPAEEVEATEKACAQHMANFRDGRNGYRGNEAALVAGGGSNVGLYTDGAGTGNVRLILRTALSRRREPEGNVPSGGHEQEEATVHVVSPTILGRLNRSTTLRPVAFRFSTWDPNGWDTATNRRDAAATERMSRPPYTATVPNPNPPPPTITRRLPNYPLVSQRLDNLAALSRMEEAQRNFYLSVLSMPYVREDSREGRRQNLQSLIDIIHLCSMELRVTGTGEATRRELSSQALFDRLRQAYAGQATPQSQNRFLRIVIDTLRMQQIGNTAVNCTVTFANIDAIVGEVERRAKER